MSIRIRSHDKAFMIKFMILTRADLLFIYNYIILLLNVILRPILMVGTDEA